RSRQHHAAQAARIRRDARPKVGQLLAHLRIERIQHLRAIQADEQKLLATQLVSERLVLRQRHWARPASRKYFSAPGWIRSRRGAAATVFAAVGPRACSSREP